MLFGAMLFHSLGTSVVLLREDFGWSRRRPCWHSRLCGSRAGCSGRSRGGRSTSPGRGRSCAWVHFQAHVRDELGLSLGTAAAAITVMTVAMVVGQLIFGGLLGDRVNRNLVIVIAMWGNTLALVILALATNFAMVLAFAVANGLAQGTRGPLMQALRAD